MPDDIELVRAEIERCERICDDFISTHTNVIDVGISKAKINICKHLKAFIDSMQEEPVSDDLQKFAEEWDESLYRSDAVIAGAKWKERQIMKDLPKWKKSQSFEHSDTINQLVIRHGVMFASSTKEIGDWFLDLSELEKLPKEE